MEILINCKPKTLTRKQNSLLLSWENVFNPENNLIYTLEIFNSIDSWNKCYWGKKTQVWVESLAPNTIYNFRIMAETPDFFSEWVDFKSATNSENYFVKHLTRAIAYSKIHSIRKIIATRPHFLHLENDQLKFPLLQATENNDFTVVNVLINFGANVNQQCSSGKKTALMMALYCGYLNIAKHLLSKGAVVDLVDVNGKNGLHYAVDASNYDSVELALEHDFPINAKDNKGWTPLIRAVIMEASDDIIKLLLKSGANDSLFDNSSLDFKKHASLCNKSHLINF